MTLPRALVFLALSLAANTSSIAQERSNSLNPLAALDKATLKGFVEQPLFELSRQRPIVPSPNVTKPAPALQVVEKPPLLHLIGLVEGTRILVAVVRRDDTNRIETLHPGDRLGTWTVEIMPAKLRMVNGNRAFDYILFKAGPLQGPLPVNSQ